MNVVSLALGRNVADERETTASAVIDHFAALEQRLPGFCSRSKAFHRGDEILAARPSCGDTYSPMACGAVVLDTELRGMTWLGEVLAERTRNGARFGFRSMRATLNTIAIGNNMHLVRRLIRSLLVSAGLAVALAGVAFFVQFLIWSYIPLISDASLSLACAPHHAIRNSAYLFKIVFVGILAVCLIRDTRLVLVDGTNDYTL